MTVLIVRCGRNPFATIEVRDLGYAIVTRGTGEVVVDIEPGTYVVSATAAGCEDRQRVEVAGEDMTVGMDVGPYPSAAPTGGTSTDVSGHARAAHDLSERLVTGTVGGCAIGVMLRRPFGAGRGMLPRRADGSLPVDIAGGGASVPLAWNATSSPAGELATAGAAVSPGAYVATIGEEHTSLLVPAWEGWQTLVFLPVTANGIAASLAVLHVIPISTSWQPTLPIAALLDQLHWALIDRPTITDGSVAALRRYAHITPATAPPLVHLLLGTLSSLGAGEMALEQAGKSLLALADGASSAAIASDVAALRLQIEGLTDEVPPASATPLLARSADVLIDHECRRLGTVGGAAVDALATRLASPLWFRWVAADADSGDRIHSYRDEMWRRSLAHAASALPALSSLDDVRSTSEPSMPRLIAYLRDESQRRRLAPADVLVNSHPGQLVRETGLPAIGLLRAMSVVPPPDGPPAHSPTHRAVDPGFGSHAARRTVVVAALTIAVVLGVLIWMWKAIGGDESNGAEGGVPQTAAPPGGTSGSSNTTPSTSSEGTAIGPGDQAPNTQPLTVTVDAAQADEADGSLVVVLSLSRPAPTAVLVDVAGLVDPAAQQPATPTVDFKSPVWPIQFDPGVVKQEVVIPIKNDSISEGDEQFLLRFAVRIEGSPQPPDVVMTITDEADLGPSPDGTPALPAVPDDTAPSAVIVDPNVVIPDPLTVEPSTSAPLDDVTSGPG